MQRQSKLRESLAQLGQEPLCFSTMLESSHEIIGEADEDHLSARLLPSPLLDPEIECVMQVDVR